MAHIPKTKKKLREMQFFMAKLEEAGTSHPNSDDFCFYLSAFHSAGRSVRDVLEEEKPASRTWYDVWEKALTPSELKLLNFMRTERNLEVHRLGAKTQDDIDKVPLARAHTHSSLPGAFADEGASIGQIVYYFEIDGKQEHAIDFCKLYQILLDRLLNDFDRAHP